MENGRQSVQENLLNGFLLAFITIAHLPEASNILCLVKHSIVMAKKRSSKVSRKTSSVKKAQKGGRGKANSHMFRKKKSRMNTESQKFDEVRTCFNVYGDREEK